MVLSLASHHAGRRGIWDRRRQRYPPISTLSAFPGALVVTWLYARWSSKKAMVLASFLTTLSVLAFLPFFSDAHHHAVLLAVVIVAWLVSANGMTSTLLAYSAEVFPTAVRATGSGVAAGGRKFGGMFGLGAVVGHFTPTLLLAAPLVAAPVALATVVLAGVVRETRWRRLEETSGEALNLTAELLTEPAAGR
jgi:MFS transporter, putative metabolite:H+ symporter